MLKVNVFIVLYAPKGYAPVVSSEGYDLFDKAENFIKNRAGDPRKIGSHIYIDEEGNNYKICEVKII